MKRNIDNWTKEEETFLRENYRKVSTETLSYLLKKDMLFIEKLQN